MSDLLVGLGIALVLEGLLWALLPDLARRIVREMASLGDAQLRGAAWLVVFVGCVLVWLVRG